MSLSPLLQILPRQPAHIKKLHTSVTRFDSQNSEKTINQVTLLGRVGADPQKRGSVEHPVINFPLATHFSYKYESGDILQKTDWHRVSVFRPGLRDTVYKYLKKGQRVYVTGKLSYGEVKLDDGQVRTASTVIADDIIFFQSQPQES
ncbi:unnamed protein product [Danaus chrysippus]|uniref:(African queen) hypothetical protein n=1 Tax=Danaus chrysippus TaxID=151541 RepID=A0A8J2QHZ4_9NEOP|nr:unnamed protein product [Danaus chrysippus]